MPAKKSAKKLETVFVLEYTHRHGTDLNVYESHELACEGVEFLVRDFADELGKVDAKLVKRLMRSKFQAKVAEGVRTYCEKSGESFEIHQLPVRRSGEPALLDPVAV